MSEHARHADAPTAKTSTRPSPSDTVDTSLSEMSRSSEDDDGSATRVPIALLTPADTGRDAGPSPNGTREHASSLPLKSPPVETGAATVSRLGLHRPPPLRVSVLERNASSAAPAELVEETGWEPSDPSSPSTVVSTSSHDEGVRQRPRRARPRADHPREATDATRAARSLSTSVLSPPLPPGPIPTVFYGDDVLPSMPPQSPALGTGRGAAAVGADLRVPLSAREAAHTLHALAARTRRGNFQIRHGEVIFKGHRSYYLMMQIKMGIKHSVEQQAHVPHRNLMMADFEVTHRVPFPAFGSPDTPPVEKRFTFKDYAPMVFRELRHRFSISTGSYLSSLCGEEALREATTPGKSGSLFYYSSDDRFIIKTVSKPEARMLLSILPQYYFHMTKNPESLITRFFGLHRITTHRLGLRRRRIRLVVMSNFLPTRTAIHVRYDLKGSTHGRQTLPEAQALRWPCFAPARAAVDATEHESGSRAATGRAEWPLKSWCNGQPRKDLDFYRDGSGPIAIDRRLRSRMLNQIDIDCLFLESVRIMDYSFLLGLHRLERPAVTAAAQPLTAHAIQTATGSKPRGSWIGVTAHGELVRIFFGVIDILDRYNAEKQLEHWWKARMLCLDDSISVIEPNSYAQRFRNFLEAAFVPLPRTPR
ncbi:hypothetical protein CDCA_CDCA04G1155 [Cyanidium caldarium]|uniref:PIPK domain-containing protein n=1 Tax=Cyanidium caldarium TaxID=2771 RepID=A0AAV9IS53_CYACA|nr:hypothetical protein CDCA_CDCA04G1155 [Cyanidium caldarium]